MSKAIEDPWVVPYKVAAAVLVLAVLFALFSLYTQIKQPGCTSGGIWECLRIPLDIAERKLS